MKLNPIALAVPFFFLFIGVEIWVARRRGLRLYRFPDALADLGCGMAQQITYAFYVSALIDAHAWVYRHHSLVRFPERSVWPWLIAFVGVELLYYWWHRLSHEVNFLWAGHVVHHQSEDFNLAVALRQSVLTELTSFPFFLSLALVGVPALPLSVMVAVNTLYQFWIHTELVGKLGPVERVLNTPSLHRVHHAINPRYIDKNYGGILIVWDILFGTYEPETEQPVYGLVAPLKSFNPLWAQFQTLLSLAARSWKATRWADKAHVWFASPAWYIRDDEQPKLAAPVSRATYVKYAVTPPRAVVAYAATHFVLLVAGTFVLMLLAPNVATAKLALPAALLIATMPALSGMLEGKHWAVPAELARVSLILAIAAVSLTAGAAAWGAALALAYSLASLAWLSRVRPFISAAPQAARRS